MSAPDRPSASHITDAELDALYARLDAHDRAPVLRSCLVPGCLARYDARAALTGGQPARPEWSAGGWRTVGSGGVLPAGGHVCPEHGGLVAAHLPRAHTQRDPIAVGADCSCGRYVTGLYRWHGAAAALWRDHLLREAEAQHAQEHACTPAGAPNSQSASHARPEPPSASETHSHARTNHKETPPCPN